MDNMEAAKIIASFTDDYDMGFISGYGVALMVHMGIPTEQFYPPLIKWIELNAPDYLDLTRFARRERVDALKTFIQVRLVPELLAKKERK